MNLSPIVANCLLRQVGDTGKLSPTVSSPYTGETGDSPKVTGGHHVC